MNTQIWKHGKVRISLTTESSASHHGIPVLRVEHPEISADLRPADLAPAAEGEGPSTAAALLVRIHAKRPLKGEALDGARRFLSQWPEGPRLQFPAPIITIMAPAPVGAFLLPVSVVVNPQGA